MNHDTFSSESKHAFVLHFVKDNFCLNCSCPTASLNYRIRIVCKRINGVIGIDAHRCCCSRHNYGASAVAGKRRLPYGYMRNLTSQNLYIPPSTIVKLCTAHNMHCVEQATSNLVTNASVGGLVPWQLSKAVSNHTNFTFSGFAKSIFMIHNCRLKQAA